VFTRIIVPLDSSPESAAALPAARVLARATGASLTLLQVIANKRQRGEVTENLERMANELAAAELSVGAVVREGSAGDQILEEISRQHTDLVIMSTHGRAGLSRMVLGSVTQRVLSGSAIPLLVVRPGERRLSQLQRLLVPVDGSPGGALALGTTMELAESSGAAIHLLEVVVPIPTFAYDGYGGSAGMYVDPSWDDDARDAARTYVASLEGRVRERGLGVTSEVVIARSVAETIVSRAEELSSDMIVMSSHALTGAARAVFGSVTDAVVRQAHCPVLVAHRPADADNVPAADQAVAVVV